MMFPLSEGCQLAGRCVCLHYNETSPLINNECGQFLFSDNIDASDVVRPWHKCVKLLVAFFRQQITDGTKYFLYCISFFYPATKFVIWKTVPVFMSKKKKIL